jgi:hypothetical protein
LPLEQQIVQACHAAHESGLNFPSDNTLSLVLCKAKNELSLMRQIDILRSNNIPHVVFKEPDMNNEITALATGPLTDDQRQLLSHWQLWR